MSIDRKKQMTLGVVLSYITIAAELLTGLLYTPLVLRLLGQSQYGIYSLVTSFIGYLTIFNGGANAAYIRFYVQTKETDKEKVDGLNGLFLVIFSALAVIGVSAGLLISRFSPKLFGDKILPQEYELVQKSFVLLAALIGVTVFNSCFNSIVIAIERFIFGKAINAISVVAAPVITAPLLYMGYDCTAIISVKLAVTGVMLIANIFFCFKNIHIKFKLEHYSKTLLRTIFVFTWFIFLQSVTDQLNWQIDKLILARTHGTAQISIYSVGATFNNIFAQLSSAVQGIFIAQVNILVSKNAKKELDDLYVRTSRFSMYVTCLVMLGFTFFGKQFILRWAGPQYISSFYVGWMLMLPLTVALTLGQQQEIGRAKNLHHIQIKINIVLCILNFLVSIPLAMKWGALGSALGTFITEVLICFIVQPIFIWKVLKMDMRRLFFELLKILPAMIIPIIVGIILNVFDFIKPDYKSIGLLAVGYTVIYAASVWFIAMNADEKAMIKKLVFRKRMRG